MSSTDATVLEARKRIEAIGDEKIRHAFMYMFLVGGEPSEVSGKYAPIGNDAHPIEYERNGERQRAVLFVVKNSRITPSKKNLHRGCVLPLDKEFEPWTEQVYNYVRQFPNENPFSISKEPGCKQETYKRNLESKALEVFEGMSWIKDVYRAGKGKVERRKIEFTSSSLSELRILNLKEFYYFNEVDLARFTGKRILYSVDPNANDLIEDILSSNIERRETKKFQELSEEYFIKLFIPLSYLNERKSTSELIREYVELNRRYNTAVSITNSIKDINYMFKARLNLQFFKEDMNLIVRMLRPCNSDDEFAQHIGSLRSVFETDMEPLKKVLPDFPKEGKSIAWTEAWLKENKIKPNLSMIETWKMINILRNNTGGFHSEPDPKILDEAYKYFGERLVLPFKKYQKLWNNVLTQFTISLDELQQIINEYEPKIEKKLTNIT
jgi:hypothetical protein